MMAKSKRCVMGCGRPVSTATSPEGLLCTLCLTEAEWENVHSDDGHGTEFEGSNDTDDCWVCHPELNEASTLYVAPVGHHDTATHSHRSHASCNHPLTPKDRAACRKAGGPKVG